MAKIILLILECAKRWGLIWEVMTRSSLGPPRAREGSSPWQPRPSPAVLFVPREPYRHHSTPLFSVALCIYVKGKLLLPDLECRKPLPTGDGMHMHSLQCFLPLVAFAPPPRRHYWGMGGGLERMSEDM